MDELALMIVFFLIFSFYITIGCLIFIGEDDINALLKALIWPIIVFIIWPIKWIYYNFIKRNNYEPDHDGMGSY
jgi:hypothetical protein